MKKVIAILATMIVLVGAVFAATNDTLTITCNVAQVDPNFILKGQLTGTGETATGSTQTSGSATLASVLDISKNDIPLAVTVAQYNNTKSKYKGTITLTITPTALTLGSDSSDLPLYSDGEMKTVTGIVAANSSIACNSSTKVVTVTLKYSGCSVTDADVASFVYTWKAKDELPPGTGYSATVQLTYNVT